jgi:hypothetical protein
MQREKTVMPIFFSIMILLGLALALNRNDDVFYEGLLSGWRGVGTALGVVGIVGLVCLWLWS